MIRPLALAALVAASCVRAHTFCDGPCSGADAAPADAADAMDRLDGADAGLDATRVDADASAGDGASDVATGTACAHAGCVAAGLEFSCALNGAGTVTCWGQNSHGELGGGLAMDTTPRPVSLARPATSIAAGDSFVCALLADTTVECWGDDSFMQLGHAGSSPAPAVIDGSTGTTAISAGARNACSIQAGAVWCWGGNSNGQSSGTGATTPTVTPPVAIAALAGRHPVQLASNQSAACVLEADGSAECWGEFQNGKLGRMCASGSGSLAPAPVEPTGTMFSQLSLGGNVGCGVAVGGAILCWGGNEPAIFGDTSLEHCPALSNQPESDWTAVSVGGDHACALATSGAASCWGSNMFGELGIGSATGMSHVATPVSGIPDGGVVAALAAGASHTCAVTTAGDLYCWGDNSVGAVHPGDATSVVPMATLVTF